MSLLTKTLKSVKPVDAKWRARATAHIERLTMPHWALGRVLDLAVDLAGITRSLQPPVKRKTIVTMAGDHGVVAQGVSLYPQEVTPQMVHNFVNGGAGINAFSRVVGAKVVVVDMGVAADLSALVKKKKILSRRIGPGTADMAVGPAMSRDDAIRSVEAGIDVAQTLAATTDVFGTGEMGIGNTTPSTAIVACLTGVGVKSLTGRGTGIDDKQFRHKIAVIEKALRVNKPNRRDGLDVLAKVGGFEIGGIAGLILGAAALHKPVLVDGFISTAGALVAHALCPASADYMIAAHRSVEQGHRAMQDRLSKAPLLDLGLRLGEGTGAALAMSIVDAAARTLTDIATFADAGVTNKPA